MRKILLLILVIIPGFSYSEDFHDLIRNHKFQQIKKEVNRGRFFLNLKDELGRTPLHLTAQNGDFKLFSYFINEGANPDLTDELKGFSSLHYASFYNRPKILRLLLARGADINKTDGKGNSPLHYAAGNGSFQNVTELIRHGAKINQLNLSGQVPLHFSCFLGRDKNKLPYSSSKFEYYLKTIRILLKNGTRSKIKDKSGRYPFCYLKTSCEDKVQLNTVSKLFFESYGW